MKINRLSAYVLDVPLQEKENAKISGGREYWQHKTIILKMETDAGIVGWGEMFPWGANYLPAYAGGVLPGLEEIVPHLMGEDPRGIGAINDIMDKSLLGHPYVKSAVDMACWDLLGKACNLPLYQLFGGMVNPKPWYQAFLPRTTGDELLAEMEIHRRNGNPHFCTKIMGEMDRDLEYIHYVGSHMKAGETLTMDVNRGYRLDEALMVARMAAEYPICFEQPCETIEECIELGKRTGVPVLLDECVHTLADFMRAYQLGPMDGLNVKISRFGGISKMLQIRDLCQSLKVPVFLQDAGGTDIIIAAIAHMSHATPARILMSSWVGWQEIGLQTTKQRLRVKDGYFYTTDAPGLGVDPDPEVLGEPKMVWS